MLTRSSQTKATLEQVMAIPGIGAQVMSSLPIPDRVRLRRTCRTFLAAADESLLSLTELFGEDAAGEGCQLGAVGLSWLMAKCPKLQTLSLAARADHEEPWWERNRYSLAWPWARYESMLPGVLSLEGIARRYQGLVCLNVAFCRDVTDAGIVAIAMSSRGLRALDVSHCHAVCDASVRIVAESCRDLRRLALSGNKKLTDASLVAVGQQCRMMEVLYADGTDATDVGVSAIARNCPRLRRLQAPDAVTDEGITQVAEHCHQLEHLGLPWRGRVTGDSIRRVATGCPQLTWLNHSCNDATDDVIRYVARRCAGLQRLYVKSSFVTDAGIKVVARSCPLLEYLDVTNCENVTGAGIKAVARNCPKLVYLAAGWCPSVGDAGICEVAAHCPALRTLDVQRTRVTDVSVRALGANCHELRYLDVGHCRSCGGGLEALARGCPQLEHLNIRKVRSVTPKGLAAISRDCKGLRVFRADETGLSEETIGKLIKGVGRTLESLSLNYCSASDESLELIAQHCPRLHGLLLGDSLISDWGIRLIAAACKRLQGLDVCASSVTRASLQLVDARRCAINQWWNGNVDGNGERMSSGLEEGCIVVMMATMIPGPDLPDLWPPP
eukprot:jgi/Mesvir1/13863/Mv16005-RA.1